MSDAQKCILVTVTGVKYTVKYLFIGLKATYFGVMAVVEHQVPLIRGMPGSRFLLCGFGGYDGHPDTPGQLIGIRDTTETGSHGDLLSGLQGFANIPGECT